MKSTPHEFQNNLDNLMSSESDKLSELLSIVGIGSGDAVEYADFSDLDITNDRLNSLEFFKTNFSGSDFSGSSLKSTSIRDCLMKGITLNNSSFVKAELANLNLTGEFSNVDFDSSRITKIKLNGCQFLNSIFKSATIVSSELIGTDIFNSNLRSIKLIDTKVEKTRFINCTLHYAALEGLIFRDVSFSDCVLDEANFIGSKFSGLLLDDSTSVINTKFSRDCGLTPFELSALESRGAMLIDDPDISPHPVRMPAIKLAAR